MTTRMKCMASAMVTLFLVMGCAGTIEPQGRQGTGSMQFQPAIVSTAPILRIETAMHTGRLKGLGIDDANRYLVTGSEDKTIRVWDLSTGHLSSVLRPPIGDAHEGWIYAVTIL
jgi:WD40 repeat protein